MVGRDVWCCMSITQVIKHTCFRKHFPNIFPTLPGVGSRDVPPSPGLGTRSVALWPRGKGPGKAWTFAATAEVAPQAAAAEDNHELGAAGIHLQDDGFDSDVEIIESLSLIA